MGRSLLKSQLERLSALEPKPAKAAAAGVSKKADKSKSKKKKSKAKKIPPPPPPPPPQRPAAETDLGYFRATLTSKASEKAREAMTRALGLK